MPKWTQIDVDRTAAANVLQESRLELFSLGTGEGDHAYLANGGARQYTSRTSIAHGVQLKYREVR